MVPSVRLSSFIRSMMFWPVTESRLAVGSSASTSCGPRHQRARDGHALPLAARQLAGPVLGVVAQADPLEQRDHARCAARGADSRRCSSSGSSTFWNTLSTETRLKLWKMKPMVLSRSSVSARSESLRGVLAGDLDDAAGRRCRRSRSG